VVIGISFVDRMQGRGGDLGRGVGATDDNTVDNRIWHWSLSAPSDRYSRRKSHD
jgi:hypothetical protein